MKETARVEAFSDGVFAIAATLLIIEIKLPPLPQETTGRDVLAALLALWPSYLAFVMSFVTILIMWINHHELFKLLQGTNRRLLFANGFMLLIVTFVNFPTAVLAKYLERAGANVAVAFYCGTYVVVALSYNLLLAAALPNLRAAAQQGPHSAVHRIRMAYRLGLLVYVAATLVALFAPYAGLAICSALWVLWTLLDYQKGTAATDG